MGMHDHPHTDAERLSAYADVGPRLPPMGELRRVTVEAHQLVLILLDITVAGPRGDHQRAARTMDRLRALVGPVSEKEN